MASLLGHCLDSIAEQTFKDFEVIIIDDGSTDHPEKVYKKYERKIDLKVFVLPKSKGVANARNLGLENSLGKYFSFISADDWYCDSNVFSDLAKLICRLEAENKTADIIKTNYKYYDSLNQKLIRTRTICDYKAKLESRNISQPFSTNDIIDDINSESYMSFPMHNEAVTRREFVTSKGLKYLVGLQRGEDSVFNLEKILGGAKIYLFDRAYKNIGVNVANSTTSSLSSFSKNNWLWIKQYFLVLQRYNFPKLFLESIPWSIREFASRVTSVEDYYKTIDFLNEVFKDIGLDRKFVKKHLPEYVDFFETLFEKKKPNFTLSEMSQKTERISELAERISKLKERNLKLKETIAEKNIKIAKLKGELNSHLGVKRSARLLAGNVKRKVIPPKHP